MRDHYMLFVRPLNETEKQTLNDAHKYHPLSRTRIRAHCIILSNRHYQIKEIALICNICRQSVSTTIHDWEKLGLAGLIDEHRPGRPKTLTKEQENRVLEKVTEHPRSIKRVLSEIYEELKIELSLTTIKRRCKSSGMSWKRIRKSLKSMRNEEDYKKAKCLINSLVKSYKSGETELYYFDESGFSLTPCIPYAWQIKGEQIEVPAAKSQKLNILGFINRDCKFESFVFTGSITTDIVIACFDKFIENRSNSEKPTIIVVDNAPTHTSIKFDKKTIELGLTH